MKKNKFNEFFEKSGSLKIQNFDNPQKFVENFFCNDHNFLCVFDGKSATLVIFDNFRTLGAERFDPAGIFGTGRDDQVIVRDLGAIMADRDLFQNHFKFKF